MRAWAPRLLGALACASGLFAGACTPPIGTCDEFGEQIVVDGEGRIMYAGQALVNGSCGAGRCHSDAAEGELRGILGFETRLLVSADYTNDTRSGIVDGPSTMVVDDRMVKVLIWYDNEYGYAFRMADLAAKIAHSLDPRT